MIIDDIKEIIARRLAFDNEDYINIQKCWDKETEILTRDIAETINFIENDCDDDNSEDRRRVEVDIRYAGYRIDDE